MTDTEPEPASILADANAAHGTDYSLVGRLPGGFQTGAYELIAPDGSRAVLKWWPGARATEQMRQAAATVDAARAAGWPTPAWLHWGFAAGGRPYEIQELVVGQHLPRLEAATLRLLLDVNRRQADLKPPTRHDWSPWVLDMVYNDREGMLAKLPQLQPVMTALRRWAGNVKLRNDDLVCGVFSLENTLFHDGHVAGIIDVEAIGRGTRAFDLAVLYSRLSEDEDENALRSELRAAAEDVEGPGAFAVCLAAEFLGLLLFVLNRKPDQVSPLVSRTVQSLTRLIP